MLGAIRYFCDIIFVLFRYAQFQHQSIHFLAFSQTFAACFNFVDADVWIPGNPNFVLFGSVANFLLSQELKLFLDTKFTKHFYNLKHPKMLNTTSKAIKNSYFLSLEVVFNWPRYL